MHILLLILKILGLAILIILGLAIVILAIGLFVPIRYKIIGHSEESMDLEIKFSFLLKFAQGFYRITKDNKEFSFGIFWGLKKLKRRKKKKDYTEDFFDEEEDLEDENEEEDFEDDEEEFEEAPEISFDDDSSKCEKQISSKTVKKKAKKKKQSFKEKIDSLKKDYFNETNKRALPYLLKQILYVLKKYLPRKAKGDLYFGTSDPATTGEILGGLSLIPLMYQRGMNVHPDFESEEYYLRGRLEAKGIAIVNVLVIAFVRLLINKDTRSLLGLFFNK